MIGNRFHFFFKPIINKYLSIFLKMSSTNKATTSSKHTLLLTHSCNNSGKHTTPLTYCWICGLKHDFPFSSSITFLKHLCVSPLAFIEPSHNTTMCHTKCGIDLNDFHRHVHLYLNPISIASLAIAWHSHALHLAPMSPSSSSPTLRLPSPLIQGWPYCPSCNLDIAVLPCSLSSPMTPRSIEMHKLFIWVWIGHNKNVWDEIVILSNIYDILLKYLYLLTTFVWLINHILQV